MLHVRVASPPDVTGRLLDTLAADPGVLNLVVLKGAARRPDGDAVQFDLQHGSANALIGVLISVTTIPAAAALGLSLAYQTWDRAGGSALQLLLNVGLLILVGAAALRIQRRIWRPRARSGLA